MSLITKGNQIELRHYRYFLALAEELNYHKAADRLYISQPGLSRQIKAMEEMLGVSLFARDSRSVRLTPAGAYLKSKTIDILNALSHIEEEVVLVDKGKLGQLRIGFLGSAMQTIIPELLVSLNHDSPLVETTLQEMSNQEQIEAILSRKIDIGFVRIPELPSSLDKCDLSEDHFILAIPSDYPLDESAFHSIKQVSHEPFILFSSDYSPHYYQTIMSIFDQAGFRPSISHKTVHAQTIFKLVEQKLGLAIVPQSLKEGFDLDIKFLAIPHANQKSTLSAVWLKNHENSCLNRMLACVEEWVAKGREVL